MNGVGGKGNDLGKKKRHLRNVLGKGKCGIFVLEHGTEGWGGAKTAGLGAL